MDGKNDQPAVGMMKVIAGVKSWVTDNSEVIHLDEKRPTLPCDLRRVVCSQSAVWRLLVQVTRITSVGTDAKIDYFRIARDPLRM